MPRRPTTPEWMRQEVARRVGARPGDIVPTSCAYCCERLIWVDWTDPKRVRFNDADGRKSPCLDHIVPLPDGPHSPRNLVLACHPCNAGKGKRSLYEWVAIRLRRAGHIAERPQAVPDETFQCTHTHTHTHVQLYRTWRG